MRVGKEKLKYVWSIILLFNTVFLYAQNEQEQIYTLDNLWNLAMENNQTIVVTEVGVDVAAQQVEIAKTRRLPEINTSLDAFYLGDATILDPDFSNKINVDMPHYGNTFTIQAQQIIFKGKSISHAIELADLQHQLAELKSLQAIQNVKLLVTANYLDLFKLYNQRNVYLKNIELAELRLKNINAMHKQDLVTIDDVIRTRLLLANFRLTLNQINNNISVINKQLTMAVGLNESTVILPDSTILLQKPTLLGLDYYLENAVDNYPGIRSARQNVKIAEKALTISKAEKTPALALFAANSLKRPVTSSSPAVDKYSNGWQVGASLSFNISSLYKAPRNISLSKLQLFQSQESLILQEQNTDVAVNAAFIMYNDAVQQLESLEENRSLANENYRMIEKKYNNQLALLIDMLDATNSKLTAELQYVNAEINILFTYYKLLNETGSL